MCSWKVAESFLSFNNNFNNVTRQIAREEILYNLLYRIVPIITIALLILFKKTIVVTSFDVITPSSEPTS